MGLFPFVYNSRSLKLKRSRWLVVYGIFLNVVLVWTIFRTYKDTETTARMELNQRNPLVEQLNNLHNCLLLLTVFITYFRIWWLSEDLGSIINKMMHLYRRHFKEYDSEDCLSFDHYIILKGLCIVLELTSMIALTIGLSPRYSYKMLLGVISTLAVQQGVLLVGMHFHLAVIYVYRFVWIINRNLLKLVYSPTRNSSKVRRLHHLYKQLLELNLRLVAIYDYQMILFMLCLLTVNIISTFYFLVYCLNNPISLVVVLNFIQSLLINIMDFWLSIIVCELAERASRGTLTILRLFNGIPNLSMDMDGSVSTSRCKISDYKWYTSILFQLNDFALFCNIRRLEYNHCGLFHIHNAMGFRMIESCVLYLVYLIQFDYMNL